MRSDTAMSAAMEAAGMPAMQVQARLQIALAVNRLEAEGVPADVIRAELRYAEERLGEGQSAIAAGSGLTADASAQPTNGDAAGQCASAGNGLASVARPSSNQRNATGHVTAAADSGHTQSARALRRDGGLGNSSRKGHGTSAPAREPSAVDIAAMRRVRQAVAVTVLDTFRVRDGRAIGDVTFGEAGRLRAANLQEAMLVKLCVQHVANPEPGMTFRDAINVETMQRFIQKSAEMADALI